MSYPARSMEWIVRHRVAFEPMTGCWLWTGRLSPDGYARLYVRGKDRYVHRLLYEEIHGPMLLGRQTDHLCRTRCCVNPDHVEPVTQKENILRGTSPPAVQARQTHCKRGHPFTPENTYQGRRHRNCRICRNQRRRAIRMATKLLLHGN